MQGEYVLLDPIGDAASCVYRAHHMASGRLVAVRLWRSEVEGDVDRALEPAQIASRVRHPVLAAVEAYGQQPDGALYIVSQYVDGDPLDRWADRTGIPPLATVVDVVHRLCVGLNAAHRNGIAHDALHPRNIRVKYDGLAPAARIEVRLLDLGIPVSMHTWPPRMHAAQFMAPEQLAGALRATAAGRLRADPRMNVYSCGCVLYYLCTGGTPYQDRNLHDLTLSHAAGKLVLPSKINPQIPPPLEAIIARALALAPNDRYPSVSDLALALSRVQLSRTSSGVRPVVIAPGGPGAAAEEDKRATWSAGFEERPTSESRVPALISLRERLTSAAEPAHDVDRPAPAGSFSSAPPPADPPTLPPPPPPSASPPPLPAGALARRAPRFEPQPISPLQPISALLEPKAAVPRGEAEPIAPEPPARAIAPSTDSSPSARARRGARPGRRAAWWLALIGGAVVGLWLLDDTLVSEEVRTTPLPSAESNPRRDAPPASTAARPTAAVHHAPAPVASATGEGAPLPPATAERAHDASRPLAAVQPARRGRVAPTVRTAARFSAASGRGPGSAPEPHLAVQSLSEGARAEPERGVQPESDAPSDVEQAESEESPADEPANAPGAPEPVPASAEPVRAGAADGAARVAAASADAKARATPGAAGPVRRLEAAARIEELTVRGSLTTSEVRRAIDRIRGQLAACYARAARTAARNGFGALRVEIEIDERGRAHAPRASGGALPGLDACVAQAAGKIVSGRPPDTGTVKASWKVAFSP